MGLTVRKFSLTVNFRVSIQMPLLNVSLFKICTHSLTHAVPNSLTWFYSFLYFTSGGMGCVILVPPPGIEPRPIAVKAWTPNLWIIMEFPWLFFFSRAYITSNIECDSFVMSIVRCLLSPLHPCEIRDFCPLCLLMYPEHPGQCPSGTLCVISEYLLNK